MPNMDDKIWAFLIKFFWRVPTNILQNAWKLFRTMKIWLKKYKITFLEKKNDARHSIQTQIKDVPFIVHPRITIFWNDNDRINSLQKNNYILIWYSLWFHKLYEIKTIISQYEIMKLKVCCHIWLPVKYMVAC